VARRPTAPRLRRSSVRRPSAPGPHLARATLGITRNVDVCQPQLLVHARADSRGRHVGPLTATSSPVSRWRRSPAADRALGPPPTVPASFSNRCRATGDFVCPHTRRPNGASCPQDLSPRFLLPRQRDSGCLLFQRLSALQATTTTSSPSLSRRCSDVLGHRPICRRFAAGAGSRRVAAGLEGGTLWCRVRQPN
jgi:hypothetical protein